MSGECQQANNMSDTCNGHKRTRSEMIGWSALAAVTESESLARWWVSTTPMAQPKLGLTSIVFAFSLVRLASESQICDSQI